MKRPLTMAARLLSLAVAIASVEATMPAPAVAIHKPSSLVVMGVVDSGSTLQSNSYSLRTLRDLQIIGWWNVPGTHVQRVEIRAPDGSLYQRLTKRFTTDTAPHVSGDGRARGTKVISRLPVGGTWMTEYSLVGSWRIELYLDNARTPIATYTLELTP